MNQIADAVLLTLVAAHAAIHVRPMMQHARRHIHKFLGLAPGEKCDRRTAAIVIAMMAGTLCVACAPVIHYGVSAMLIVASQ